LAGNAGCARPFLLTNRLRSGCAGTDMSPMDLPALPRNFAAGAVSAVNYQGPTGGLITAGEQCAYAVEPCVKPRS
jgi:hypothetical protein